MKARVIVALKLNYLYNMPDICVANKLHGKPEYPRVDKEPQEIAGFSKWFFYPSGFI